MKDNVTDKHLHKKSHTKFILIHPSILTTQEDHNITYFEVKETSKVIMNNYLIKHP